MHAGADAVEAEPVDDDGPVGAVGQEHDREVVGSLVVEVAGHEPQPGHLAEPGPVALHDGPTPGLELAEAGELRTGQGGEHVGEVGLDAGGDHVVAGGAVGPVAGPGVLREPVEAVGAGEVGQVVVVGGQRPAFARGEVLGGVEAEARPGAALPGGVAPMVGGAERVGAVFDQGEAGLGADVVDLFREGVAGEVHPDDGVEPGGGLGQRGGGEVEGVGVDVQQHRGQVVVHRGQGRGDEGPGGDPDLRPGGQVEVGEGDLERRGARRHPDHVRDPEVVAQLLFEQQALGPGGDPPGAQHPGDGVDVVVGDVGGREEHRAVGLARRDRFCHLSAFRLDIDAQPPSAFVLSGLSAHAERMLAHAPAACRCGPRVAGPCSSAPGAAQRRVQPG